MKSDSGSAPRRNKWRLKITLKRAVDFRPIEDDDIRYVFAAYKNGALYSMGEPFMDTKMTADAFRDAFQSFVVEHYHAAWTLFAMTRKGFIPVGVVFGAWAPSSSYMIVNGMIWFPWASSRNKVETMVNFLNGVRGQVPLVFYAMPEHKRMYEVCAMHGIIRRVGTSQVAIPGHQAAVFETRAA